MATASRALLKSAIRFGLVRLPVSLHSEVDALSKRKPAAAQ